MSVVVGNSDVWGMQCFCSVVSKMVSEPDRWACSETSLESNTASPKHLNYQPLNNSQIHFIQEKVGRKKLCNM